VKVEAQAGDGGSVLEHYRRLIRLRRELAVFSEGDFEELAAESELIGGYRRRLGDEVATVWCNFSRGTVALPDPVEGEILLDPTGRFDGRALDPWQSVVVVSSREET
jgi:glycosidase